MIDAAVVEQRMRDANPVPTVADIDDDELALAVAAADSRRAAVMQAPTHQPTPVTAKPPRRRTAWAFAAAFILVIAAIGIAALAIRGGDTTPVTTEPMAPTAIDVQSLIWTRVPHDEAVFNPTAGIDRMWSVTVGGPGFVAVGAANDERDADAAVWVSEDGITWSSLVAAVEPESQWMESIALGGPGLVAVGVDFNAAPVAVGAVWTSEEDGMSWSKVTVQPATSWIHDVTAGGPGLVAVGAAPEGPGCGGGVWTSVDGITWNLTSHDREMLCGITSVTAGGPGLVAVGEWGSSAVVWTSPDGFTWTRVPHDEAVFGGVGLQSMSDVVAAGPGLVAVGSEGFHVQGDMGGTRAAVWTSPDGFTWTRVPHDSDIFGGEAGDERSMHTVASVDGQLLAIGDGEAAGIVVWTSVDGVTWTRSAIPGDGTMHSVAVFDSGLIAVGEQDGAAAVWLATEG